MFALLLVALQSAPSRAQFVVHASFVAEQTRTDERPRSRTQTPPDPARVEEVVRAIDRAFQSGDTAGRVQAIQSAASVTDGDVVTAVARGLRDRELDVRKAAIEVLRWMDHPSSVKELQAAARKDTPIHKDPASFAALLKAIGQHADPSSIAIFTDDVWGVRDHDVIQARILGLGWIRTRASAEALIDLLKVGGPRKLDGFMGEVRLSLLRITGADQGTSTDLWLAWWNDHKSKLEIPADPPQMPAALEARWREYWDLRPNREARRARKEGDEPAKDGKDRRGDDKP